jgi:hypothetical protein
MIHERVFFTLVLGAFLFCCDSADPTALTSGNGSAERNPYPTPANPTQTSHPAVYMSGFIGSTGVYWKDGAATVLEGARNPTAIEVHDNDIYIAGFGNNGTNNYAVYWKNGVETILPDEAYGAYASDLTVSGQDVYVSGHIYTSANSRIGVYWKNGVVNVLPNCHSAESIYVVRSDVYIAGNTIGLENAHAAYWKNGVLVTLPNSEYVTAITVYNSDVYVTGSILYSNPGTYAQKAAAYWKNGELNILNDGTYATSIMIDGSDIYIGGYKVKNANGTEPIALFWKNKAVTTLTEGRAHSLSKVDSTIYLCGIDNNYNAVYWKAGMPIKLTADFGYGPVSVGLANGISVN